MFGKYRCLGKQMIDPTQVRVVIRVPAAVDYYCENPGGTYNRGWLADNGGVPTVFVHADGSMTADEGNHRIAAAARCGRKIKAEVWTDREMTPQQAKHKRGWW